MQTKRFQRCIEDFSCERCGYLVQSSGYTNHCPACLWSKHVDVNPGDRLEECRGLMRPIEIERSKGEYAVVHRCLDCGAKKRNRLSESDDWETIVKIAAHSREMFC